MFSTRRVLSSLLAVVALAGLPVACGGKAVIDPAPSTTTGAGGSAASGGGTTGDSCVCPALAPSEGAPCACSTELSCEYEECGVTGEIQHFECADERWRLIATESCEESSCTDGLTCDGDEMCVVRVGFTNTYSCELNPCGDLADCMCLQALCGPDYTCTSISGDTLICECLDC